MNRQEAHALIDSLDATEYSRVAQYLKSLEYAKMTHEEYLASLPTDDEELTAEEIEAYFEGRAQLDRGEGIPHEEILREFGLLK